TTPKRLVSPANDTQTVGEPREPTPCVAGAQRSTPQRRICFNQRDLRNPREILWRSPNWPKCQTKSEHRELFTNRPKAIKRVLSAAIDTQTVGEPREPTPYVAGAQRSTHKRRICFNQRDLRNPREILWRSPNWPKCQTKSEHRELFTNRPKAIKRVLSAAIDTQTVGEPREPTPYVAGAQRSTHKRRICFNQRDLRNPREILWRSPKRTKCQTKSEHRELFTNRPKAIKRVVSTANDTQTVGEPREPTPCVAGAQRSTPKRRICFNQRDLRNPREILWRSPKRTKCQTKSEHRELFTNRPKAIKRVVSTANDTQTVGEPREPTPCVAGAQRTTPQRRICFNQRDLRNPREILWRSPKRTKCQTKSEHRELFTKRPKATKRGVSAANDTQTVGEPREPTPNVAGAQRTTPKRLVSPANQPQTWRERSERHPNVEFASQIGLVRQVKQRIPHIHDRYVVVRDQISGFVRQYGGFFRPVGVVNMSQDVPFFDRSARPSGPYEYPRLMGPETIGLFIIIIPRTKRKFRWEH